MTRALLPLVVLTAAALAPRAFAGDPPAPGKDGLGNKPPRSHLGDAGAGENASPTAAALAALKRECKDAAEERDRRLKTATTPQAEQQAWKDHRARRDAVVSRAVELAREHPRDPAAFAALEWVIAGGIGWGPPTDAAFDLLEADYLASGKLEPVCLMAALYNGSPKAGHFLQSVLEKSPHRSLRGVACLSLGRRLKYEADGARYEKRPDAERLQREAEKYYDRVTKEFADVKLRNRPIGERADAALFEMRELVVGHAAPEIAGEDVDGKKFRLSDYRGKVVVLDFWGNW